MRIRQTVVVPLAAGLLAACSGGGDPTIGGGGDGGDVASTIEVTAGDLFFEPTDLSAPSGTVTIELENQGAAVHTLVIEETGETVAEAAGGETDTGTIELEPGSYSFYCDVPGHRQGGMEGTLTVS